MAFTFNESVGVSYDADQSYFDGPDDVIVDLVGEAIDSAGAFGTFVIDQRVFGNGLASSEAFGTLNAKLLIDDLTGIPSVEAVPTGGHVKHSILAQGFVDPTVLSVNGEVLHKLYLTGIPSEEVVPIQFIGYTYDSPPAGVAFDNDPGYFDGPETWTNIYPIGLISAEAFGELSSNIQLYITAIASAEVFGSGQVNQSLAGSGISSEEVSGTGQINHQIQGQGFVDPTILSVNGNIQHQLDIVGIPSAEASDSQRFSYPYDATPVPWTFDNDPGIFDGTEFWTAISLLGIASEEAFGIASVAFTFSPVAIVSEEAFGNLQVTLEVVSSAIGSLEVFGSLRVNHQLLGQGFVDPTILSVNGQVHHSLDFVGISTAELFGTTRFGYTYDSAPSPWSFDNDQGTFDGTELWGTILNINVGISSEEVFGGINVLYALGVAGLATEEVFGSSHIGYTYDSLPVGCSFNNDAGFFDGTEFWTTLCFTGIPSEEAFGTAAFSTPLLVTGILSEEAFGAQRFGYTYDGTPAPWSFDNEIITFDEGEAWQAINFLGIESLEVFGTPNTLKVVRPVSIASDEAFGNLRIVPGFAPIGIESQEGFGISFISLKVDMLSVISAEAFGRFDIEAFLIWEPATVSETAWMGDIPVTRIWTPDFSRADSWAGATLLNSTWLPLSAVAQAWSPDSKVSAVWTAPVISISAWAAGAKATTSWSPDSAVDTDWDEAA